MGPHQVTRRNPATPEDQAAMQAFLEQSQRDADRVNAQFVLAKQQQDAAEFQNSLVEKTQLSLEQLCGIREWLKHNS